MDETIYRQDAIDALWEERMKYSKEMERNLETCSFALRADNKARQSRVDEDIEIIRQLPSAQEWIQCSERLPEVNGRYLVTRGLNACGVMWDRVYLINYSDLMGLKSERIWWNGNVGKSDFEHIDDVVAWMPLPQPYKETQDETDK